MQFYTVDPLSDSRWGDLVASHPRASVFHQVGWLRALATTYGYRVTALTSTPPAQKLADGLAFCEVKSWVTGGRLVSLPFSDHAEPLFNEHGPGYEMVEWMEKQCRSRNWKYIELRPVSEMLQSHHPLAQSESFWLHTLDLTRPIEQLFRNLHKSCIQRRIRHAEREHLTYQKGRSKELLEEFYELLMITRRRFRLLPQPRAWFRNLIANLTPNAEIRLVRKEHTPVAAIFTLRHRGTVIYKYGCSDEKYHHLGGMPFLFWKLIEESKAENADEIDFGRTDLDNEGLTRFKDSLGTVRRHLNYLQYPPNIKKASPVGSKMGAVRKVFSILPDALSSRLGQLAYRHMG